LTYHSHTVAVYAVTRYLAFWVLLLLSFSYVTYVHLRGWVKIVTQVTW